MRYIALLMLLSFSLAAAGQSSGRKIMLFGGLNHKVYLGCLNCSAFAQDSTSNRFGEHGSKFQTESIFNQYGSYGGRYSDTSPCNAYAYNPPVVVDERGAFYGELTLNKFRPKRIRSEKLLAWLSGVCEAQ